MDIVWQVLKKDMEGRPCRWSTIIGGITIQLSNASKDHNGRWVVLTCLTDIPIDIGGVDQLGFEQACDAALAFVGNRVESSAVTFREVFRSQYATLARRRQAHQQAEGAYVTPTYAFSALDLGRGSRVAPPMAATPFIAPCRM
jgi:hypothetical protein